MTSSPRPHTSCEDVLFDFATSQEGTTAETLHIFIQRFPEYENDLRSLFETIEAEDATEFPVEMGRPQLEVSLQERVRSIRAQLNPAGASVSRKEVFTGSTPQEMRHLTKELNVSPLFMAKLKDRLIDGSTMPSGFIVWLAAGLGEAAETVRDYFSADTRMAQGIAFKAEGKPGHKLKQTFSEAMESSGLTEEQKAILREVSTDQR